jgi:hypothetical protein
MVSHSATREAVTPDELAHARELLWSHFEVAMPPQSHSDATSYILYAPLMKYTKWRLNDSTAHGYFEGTESGLERMQQNKPVGWKRDDVTTWTHMINGEGKVGTYGEGGMTSTAHCVRRSTCPTRHLCRCSQPPTVTAVQAPCVARPLAGNFVALYALPGIL